MTTRFSARLCLLLSMVALLPAGVRAEEQTGKPDESSLKPYVQTKDVIYGEVDGVGLLMDVFAPTGKSNGLAMIDVASGAFYSDRGKINDHIRAQVYDIFCGKGYTVFAVRPGSITKFGIGEMADNIKTAIALVRKDSQRYQINPDCLGITGGSAGGNLASLVAVTAGDKLAIKAAGVFFPPTDFLEYRGQKIDENSPESAHLQSVRRFVSPTASSLKGAQLVEKLKAISPALLVTSSAPPFLIVHGDKDPLVPLAQSEKLIAALKKANVPAELIIKEGGAHPWPTIHEEVLVMANWFDKQLLPK